MSDNEDGAWRHFAGECGYQVWRHHGQIHREDGPAIIARDGSREWFFRGRHHREGGPAVEHANGMQVWYRHGEVFREEGPAIVFAAECGKAPQLQATIQPQPRAQPAAHSQARAQPAAQSQARAQPAAQSQTRAQPQARAQSQLPPAPQGPRVPPEQEAMSRRHTKRQSPLRQVETPQTIRTYSFEGVVGYVSDSNGRQQ